MNILFLCVANSARSQMAEGLAKNIFKNLAKIESAGSKPSQVNPTALSVMNEWGIDLSSHFSKSVEDLDPDFIEKLDYIITLCAEEVCPILNSKAKKLHWPFPDPKDTDQFRQIRDSLSLKIQELKINYDNL